MRKPNRARSCVETAIPADVGDRFEAELKSLVESLARDGTFKSQYLRDEIFSKYCGTGTTAPHVRRSAAIGKFMAAERRNAKTNARLITGDVDFGWIKWLDDDPWVESNPAIGLRTYIRQIISQVLGPLRYPAILWSGTHTNGASTRCRRSPTAALSKLTGLAHTSKSALEHWGAATNYTRLDLQPLTFQEDSVLFTVPKKSDIDRVACKEPEINMYLQKSVGNHIRARLKKFGIDLNDQSKNQELARIAVDRKLATIDLSSASDSITRQLVIELLPFEWWALLDDLRVKSTLVEWGGFRFRKELEMFSSMGNGFTFELESLLFYAITRAVLWRSGIKGHVSVYGDDIIAPSRIVPRLKRVFDYLGFKFNLGKTHHKGFFRESCGAHFWKGFDVKPFYVRRAVRTLQDLINILNRLLEWDGRGWGFFTTEEAYRFWLRWRGRVPRFLWGGVSCSDPTALVTGHPPRQRLVPVTRSLSKHSPAGLSYWLLSCERNKGRVSNFAPIVDLSPDDFWEVDLSDEGPGHLVVDPRRVIGFKSSPMITRGERTTWSPGLIFEVP